jgi:DNA-binding GntR family transcriptional regulator
LIIRAAGTFGVSEGVDGRVALHREVWCHVDFQPVASRREDAQASVRATLPFGNYDFLNTLSNMSPKPAKKKTLKRIPGVAASHVAYERLIEEIIEGSLRPGQRITEAEIADVLKLGKTPVREALRRLVLERLVVLLPRNGYKIAPITLSGVEELCGLRLVVEPAAVALSLGNLTAAQLTHLEKLAKVGYEPTDRDSVRAFLDVNREFHALIVSACGNARLATLVDQLHFESYRIFQIQLMNYPDSEHHVNLHRDLVEALRAGDGPKARKLSEREIAASRHFIVTSLLKSRALQTVAVMD